MVITVFSIGWIACIGYLNFAYHYNFIDSQRSDIKYLVSTLHMRECQSENNYNLFSDKWHHADGDTFYNESFTCLESKSRNLGSYLILMATGYEQMVCLQKADRNDSKEEREKCIDRFNENIDNVKRELSTDVLYKVRE